MVQTASTGLRHPSSNTATVDYAIGLEKNYLFFNAQMSVSLQQTDNSNYSRCFFCNRPPSTNKTNSFELRRNVSLSLSVSLYPERMCFVFTCILEHLLPQFYWYLQLSESANTNTIGGQLRGNKERHFSGLTSSGRVWRKKPESDARSVKMVLRGFTVCVTVTLSQYIYAYTVKVLLYI